MSIPPEMDGGYSSDEGAVEMLDKVLVRLNSGVLDADISERLLGAVRADPTAARAVAAALLTEAMLAPELGFRCHLPSAFDSYTQLASDIIAGLRKAS